jgi:hypothetical protein
MTDDVVDSRVGHEPSDRGVRTPLIVEARWIVSNVLSRSSKRKRPAAFSREAVADGHAFSRTGRVAF